MEYVMWVYITDHIQMDNEPYTVVLKIGREGGGYGLHRLQIFSFVKGVLGDYW